MAVYISLIAKCIFKMRAVPTLWIYCMDVVMSCFWPFNHEGPVVNIERVWSVLQLNNSVHKSQPSVYFLSLTLGPPCRIQQHTLAFIRRHI